MKNLQLVIKLVFRNCDGCRHRFGRIQIHDLPWPWSLGVASRGLLTVRNSFKRKAASSDYTIHAVFDGGILLHEFKKGEIGLHVHVIVGKGGSDRKLNYVGFHM